MARSEEIKHRVTGSQQAGEGRRILVVDDDPTMRMIFEMTLLRAGYEVTEAEDGARAVEIFVHGPAPFDAVLLDLVMPKLNGFEAFRRMRRHRPGIPVIVVSGVPPAEAFAGLFERSRLAYLRKPVDPEFLVHQLAELLASP